MANELIQSIQKQHEDMLTKLEEEEEFDLEEVPNFLDSIASTGSKVQDIAQRSLLRSLIRFWASFIQDKTGNFPIVNLHPYEDATHLSKEVRQEIENSNPEFDEGSNTEGLNHLKQQEEIGQYSLIERIGQGGFSTVYLGKNPEDHDVAVKIFEEKHINSEYFKEILFGEKLAQSLDHPNIVKVHDILDQDGKVYIVMDYVGGGSLGERISNWFWRPTVMEVLNIFQQIAEGLAYLHKNGIVHRDIKPGNILLGYENREAYITDFGIARLIENFLDKKGVFIGTPEYMSPETLQSPDKIDEKADIYSLGVVFYEVFSGKPLFLDKSPQTILNTQLNNEIKLNTLLHGVNPKIVKTIMSCLEVLPKYRPTALELSLSLRLAVEQDLSETVLNSRIKGFVKSPEQRYSIPRADKHSTVVSPTPVYAPPKPQTTPIAAPPLPDPNRIMPFTTLPPASAPPTTQMSYLSNSATKNRSTLILSPNIMEESNLPIAIILEINGLSSGKIFPIFESTYILGRAQICHVGFVDQAISEQHALLVCKKDKDDELIFKLFDLGSGNGTQVNGVAIEDYRQLEHNDEITIGQTTLLLKRLDI